MGKLDLSGKERQRLDVLRKVKRGEIGLSKGTEMQYC